MAKRKTKQQREAEQKAALRQRLDDLFVASTGDLYDGESEPWPESFIDFVGSIRQVFQIRRVEAEGIEGNEHLWLFWNLKHYRNPEAATEYLYQEGIRA